MPLATASDSNAFESRRNMAEAHALCQYLSLIFGKVGPLSEDAGCQLSEAHLVSVPRAVFLTLLEAWEFGTLPSAYVWVHQLPKLLLSNRLPPREIRRFVASS